MPNEVKCDLSGTLMEAIMFFVMILMMICGHFYSSSEL